MSGLLLEVVAKAAGLLIAVVSAALVGWWKGPRNATVTFVVLGGAAIVLGGFWSTTPGPGVVDARGKSFTELAMPRAVTDHEYVSSNACRDCHPEQYNSWHRSFHRTMTQLATSESVLAPFDNVQLGSGEEAVSLERVGDEFWVDMVNPEWQRKMFEQGMESGPPGDPPRFRTRVVMTTGSHRRQSYWVLGDPASRGNRVFQLPWTYHIGSQTWIPLKEAFLAPSDRRGIFLAWNEVCIHCHSVAGRPNLQTGSGALFSEVAEFGIACEACHGPGGRHVHRQRTAGAREGGSADLAIVNPANQSHRVSSEICGQCHSVQLTTDPDRWWSVGRGYRPGENLAEVLNTPSYDEAFPTARHAFWADGTIRVGGREYNALLASACFQRGELSCLSCHSMHSSDPSGQLGAKMHGNEACLQCHESMRDQIEEHTHHPPSSSGSLCYNCHMPHTSYARYRAIRSHRIDIPSVATSVETGRPQACNLCHLDKTLAWTDRHLTQWYGGEGVEMTSDQQQISAVLLWLLKGDAAQRYMATAALGWEPALEASGSSWTAPFLGVQLEDPYSSVRWAAYDALQRLPGYEQLDYDFVGPESQRAAAHQRVLDIFAAQSPSSPVADDDGRLLLNPDGSLQRQVIDRLLQQRDLSDVYIKE